MVRGVLLALAASTLHAATIRGTVVENQTGYPLARATVTVETVGNGAAPQSVHTNVSGIFEFAALPAGTYRISAAKTAFAPVNYGQKRWYSPGMPIPLAADDTASLTIRMPRYGAITGTVRDENDVGLPEHQVAVYTNTRPPKLLARATTDDRGMYRLFGLRPGSYLIRSLAKVYDDESYLPTFYPESPTVDQAHAVDVTLDEQVDHVDVPPMAGRLFSVSGRVIGVSGHATVALSSDAGTETAATDERGNFAFHPMAPGQYELLADAPADRSRGRAATFRILTVDRDLTDVAIPLSPLPAVQFVFEDKGGHPIDLRGVSPLVRHKDAASEGPTETLQEPRVTLLPGRWDVAMPPGAAYCVVGFSGPQSESANQGRTDGWNEILLAPNSQNVVKFVLSSSPATMGGTVRNSGGDAVAGVPVFIEPYDLEPRKRLEPVRIASTDGKGQYSLGGLAPGAYRVMASFDYQMPEPSQMEAARAPTVRVDEGAHAVLDLEEFVVH
jgi:protocatechuate 3,4-dioxygenase beta subunit